MPRKSSISSFVRDSDMGVLITFRNAFVSLVRKLAFASNSPIPAIDVVSFLFVQPYQPQLQTTQMLETGPSAFGHRSRIAILIKRCLETAARGPGLECIGCRSSPWRRSSWVR